MREIPTFLETKIATSIKVGRIFVLANFLAEHLKSYTAPALFHNEDYRPYHLTKGGSISLLKYKKRNFALASYHQFLKGNYQFDQLCISNPTRSTLLTPHTVFFPDGSPDQKEDYDCVLLEYTETVQNGLLPNNIWFDFENSEREEPKYKPVALLCIGYPSHRNYVNYDLMSYAVAPNVVWGTQEQSDMSGRRSFTPLNTLDFEPSGMSGAPVFRIDRSGSEFSLNFAGILTEATSQRFNYFSIDRIFPNYL